LVERTTGWDLQVSTLSSRVLPKDSAYEEIILRRIGGPNLQIWQEMMPDVLERLMEFLVEQNVLAAYMPVDEEILVVRENVDESNLDGLRLILAHELVHRGQHVAHGHLFTRLEDILHQILAAFQRDHVDLQDTLRLLDQVQPIMTLLESHAHFIQDLLKQTTYPNARIEAHFNIATLLMRLVGVGKVAQYTDALPQVSAAAKAGKMDALFQNV
jgi:hypothetical protein